MIVRLCQPDPPSPQRLPSDHASECQEYGKFGPDVDQCDLLALIDRKPEYRGSVWVHTLGLIVHAVAPLPQTLLLFKLLSRPIWSIQQLEVMTA